MKTYKDPEIKLDEALSFFGNKASMAKFLGIHRVTVTQWVNKYNFEYVPAIHAYRINSAYPNIFSKDAA